MSRRSRVLAAAAAAVLLTACQPGDGDTATSPPAAAAPVVDAAATAQRGAEGVDPDVVLARRGGSTVGSTAPAAPTTTLATATTNRRRTTTTASPTTTAPTSATTTTAAGTAVADATPAVASQGPSSATTSTVQSSTRPPTNTTPAPTTTAAPNARPTSSAVPTLPPPTTVRPTTTTAAPTTVPPTTVAPTTVPPTVPPTTLPPGPSTATVIGAANTTNLCAGPVPAGPSGSGVTRTPAATVGAVGTAIASAAPGDVVVVANGSYGGTLTITANGTATDPIVVKAATPGGVVWTSGQIIVKGSWIVLSGFTVTAQQQDFLQVTDWAHDVRVNDFTFQGAGDGSDGSSVGLIKVAGYPGWSWQVGPNFPGAPTIVRNVLIDQSSFLQPRNTVLWVQHGTTGVKFCHNEVVGPHGITGGGETMALKFGFSSGFNEDAQAYISFNTFRDWEGRPYLIGIKMGGVHMYGNLIARGRVEFRATSNSRFVGNVILDGDFQGGGANHVIAKNYIRTVNDRDGFGPFMIYNTTGWGVYQGDGNWFTVGMTNSLITQNTLFNSSSSYGFAVVMRHSQYEVQGPKATGNTFSNNLFASDNTSVLGRCTMVIDNGWAANTADFKATNTFTNNVEQCGTANTAPPTAIDLTAADLI